MIFGIAMTVVGYAVLYWGIHHFCGVDCPCPPGTNDCSKWDPCSCRYSLIDLLGLAKFGIGRGAPVQYK